MTEDDLHGAIDRGFATQASIRDAATDLDDPAAILAYAREIVANDPEGAACVIFASIAEDSEGEAETANLGWLYEEWMDRNREKFERRREQS